MKIKFRVAGTIEIPDSVVMHEDILNQLYALEFNDMMYMLQVCVVAEAGAGGYDILHQYEEMENHNIKNVHYDNVNFVED